MWILEFTIAEEESGWSVEHFLKMRLQFGKKQISRLKFRQDGLVLNGVQCRSVQVLQTGDRLAICLDETGKQRRELQGFSENMQQPICEVMAEQKRLPADHNQLQILYEDEDVLAVYKPGGISLHPGHGHGTDTLWNLIVSYQMSREENWTPRIIGRLDKDTSGIILVAKTTEAAAALAAQREDQRLRKCYIAEAEGIFRNKQGCIDLAIEKDPDCLNRMRVGENGLEARTHYRVLEEREGRSVLELHLEHGRTHQIRVHLSYIGHPIVGDPIYNFESCEQDGLHLHAGKLRFFSPFTGVEKEIEAPFPNWKRLEE